MRIVLEQRNFLDGFSDGGTILAAETSAGEVEVKFDYWGVKRKKLQVLVTDVCEDTPAVAVRFDKGKVVEVAVPEDVEVVLEDLDTPWLRERDGDPGELQI